MSNPPDIDIARLRLINQHLARPVFETAGQVAGWLGAVQAQDYEGAKWALAQRMPAATSAALDRAFTEGSILRTHVLRPTWHFVSPADLRWLLALTGPRVHAASAYYYRQLALNPALVARSNTLLAEALRGGNQLTRAELAAVLLQAGLPAEGLRLTYLVMCAELDGVICSGAKRGKQFTYALLDERAPQAASLPRDEALAQLAARYFTSHGPATLNDFAWWSGLTVADARAGVELLGARLAHQVSDGRTYWFAAAPQAAPVVFPGVYLLPNYDEYLVSYKDRSASVDPQHADLWDRGSVLFSHPILVDGQVSGLWKRTLKKDAVLVDCKLFVKLKDAQLQAVESAVQRYGEFLGLPARLNISAR